ncbi:MAG: hypothetical protein L0K86_16025 [Actinomycetia bacterium]|nr:hypothetical protein [Actinomycetes bacterium]
MTSGPIDLYVDLGELGRVQQELASLLSALTDLGGNTAVEPSDIGSADVADAVRHFVSAWGDARNRIIENVRACQQLVAAAVSAYQQTDDGLRSVLQPTGTAERNAQ